MKRLALATLVSLFAGWAFAADNATLPESLNLREPQLAVRPKGDGVFLAAASPDGVIAVASSTDGSTWSAPVTVATAKSLMLGMRRGPRIAATAKSIVVTAVADLGTGQHDLGAWRSADGGATWSGPVRLDTSAGGAQEGLSALAAGPDERVAAVWLDSRGGKGNEVWATISKDGGATWGKDFVVYRSPDGHVCECCHPSVAWNAKGELAVQWRNWLDGARDLWMTASKDSGATFAKPVKLGDQTWPLRACPMDGGAIASAPDGSWSTIWRRKNEVVAAAPGKPERVLLKGMQPWLAPGPGGVFAVSIDESGSGIVAFLPGESKPALLGKGSASPVVAGALDGKGPVVAAWGFVGGGTARVTTTVLALRK